MSISILLLLAICGFIGLLSGLIALVIYLTNKE